MYILVTDVCPLAVSPYIPPDIVDWGLLSFAEGYGVQPSFADNSLQANQI